MKIDELEKLKSLRDIIKNERKGEMKEIIHCYPSPVFSVNYFTLEHYITYLVDDLDYAYQKIAQLESAILGFENELKNS